MIRGDHQHEKREMMSGSKAKDRDTLIEQSFILFVPA